MEVSMTHESVKPAKYQAKDPENNVVRDWGNDPYFVRKADASQKFLEGHGFPKDIFSKKTSHK
jgi:hypothetical protein